jgi:hypothetical protein
MKYALILSVAFAMPVHAEIISGNRLLEYLSAPSSSYSAWGFSRGFVTGVYDAQHYASHCAPAGITVSQIGDMSRVYLEANPATRHEPASNLLGEMFTMAWPCAKKPRPNL